MKSILSLATAIVLFAGNLPCSRGLDLGIVTGRIYSTMNSSTAVQDDMYNMGTRWIRIEFEEYSGTPTSLAQYQKILNDCQARGISVLGVLTANSCMDHTNPIWTEQYIANFYAAFKWHVQQYPWVTYWEIWNEPSVYGFAGHLDGYGLLLKRVFESARADRNSGMIPAATRIVSGGVLNQDANVLHGIYDSQPVNDFRAVNGGDIPCDFFAYHPYGNQGPGLDPDPYSSRFNWGRTFEQSWNDFQNLRTYNNAYYIVPQNKGVFMTEFGFDAAQVGTENQRIYTERMIAVMNAYSRIQKAFHYDYADDTEGQRGLKTTVLNGQRKRVYYPYMSHTALTGLYTPDGVNEWTLDQFIDCYLRNGGRNSVGMPYRDPAAPWYGDKVHDWSDGKVQNYSGGAWGTSSAILESPRNVGNAFWVHAGFWDTYKNLGGPYSALKFPTSDEFGYNGGTRQNFEGGYMTWTSAQGVQVFYN
jgi:hypothetical protein